jgi:hypothetical protein
MVKAWLQHGYLQCLQIRVCGVVIIARRVSHNHRASVQDRPNVRARRTHRPHRETSAAVNLAHVPGRKVEWLRFQLLCGQLVEVFHLVVVAVHRYTGRTGVRGGTQRLEGGLCGYVRWAGAHGVTAELRQPL